MGWHVRPRARKKPGKMNKWEAAYADRLELFKLEGGIIDWRYEPIKFRLAPNTFYTIDFMIITIECVEFHEVKGFHRDDAIVKFKVCAEMYPWFKWRMIGKNKQGWHTVMEF